jgi:hypothetical protein
MSSVLFKQKKFSFPKNGYEIPVSNIKVGDIILKSNGSLFWIDDIESFYINDKVAELYSKENLDNEIKPEHSKYTFYGGKSLSDTDNEITEIPYDAKFYVFRHYSRKHMEKLK